MYKSRLFSNHNEISYNDYITNKRRTSLTHPELQKKIMINNYYASISCEKAPMKMCHYPTSYICNNNIHDSNICKQRIESLYPYGRYMCKSIVCNTCVSTGQQLENPTSDAMLKTNQASQVEYNILDFYDMSQ